MKEQDKKRFVQIMAVMSEAMRDNVSMERAKIYFQCLAEYSVEEVERAAVEAIKIRTYQGIPLIGELIAIIKENRRPQEIGWEDLKQRAIEWKQDSVEADRAKEMVQKISAKLEADHPTQTARESLFITDEKQIIDFERKRKEAKEKADRLLKAM